MQTQTESWRRFEKEFAGETCEDKQKKVVRLEYKVSSLLEFLRYAALKMKDFLMHNFIAQWQDKEYKLCVQNLREGDNVVNRFC